MIVQVWKSSVGVLTLRSLLILLLNVFEHVKKLFCRTSTAHRCFAVSWIELTHYTATSIGMSLQIIEFRCSHHIPVRRCTKLNIDASCLLLQTLRKEHLAVVQLWYYLEDDVLVFFPFLVRFLAFCIGPVLILRASQMLPWSPVVVNFIRSSDCLAEGAELDYIWLYPLI